MKLNPDADKYEQVTQLLLTHPQSHAHAEWRVDLLWLLKRKMPPSAVETLLTAMEGERSMTAALLSMPHGFREAARRTLLSFRLVGLPTTPLSEVMKWTTIPKQCCRSCCCSEA